MRKAFVAVLCLVPAILMWPVSPGKHTISSAPTGAFIAQNSGDDQADSTQRAITGIKQVIRQLEAGTRNPSNDHLSTALGACRDALHKMQSSPPDLQGALFDLKLAQAEMSNANVDKGGHRVAAIKTIRDVTRMLERGMTPAPNAAIIRVFYATDRAQLKAESLSFGAEKGDGNLRFGAFDVSIPRDHRLANIERPVTIWRFHFTEDPEKHFVILGRTAETEASFYADVRQTFQKSSTKDAYVFIHGYNVGFEDAVYRTAQIAYDLGFGGAPILYSWPSNGEAAAYTWDLNANDWTVPHLSSFLTGIASKTGARTIHVIAHSMGNRALVNDLNLMKEREIPRFDKILLTAPDIDADTFIQLAHAVQTHARRATLYVSSRDKALAISRKVNGGRRAGDSDGDVVIVSGIDTIDAAPYGSILELL